MIDQSLRLSRTAHPSLDLNKWQTTVNLIAELYECPCGTIVQYLGDSFHVVSASNTEGNFLEQDASWPWELRSFCRRIIETGEGLYVGNAKADAYWREAPPVLEWGVRSYLGLPITWPDNTLFGTICVIDTKETDYNDVHIRLLEQLRDLINADLKHIHDFEKNSGFGLKR